MTNLYDNQRKNVSWLRDTCKTLEALGFVCFEIGLFNILSSLATSKRNPWKDEKQLLESGLHSQFVDGISQCRELCEQKLERIADIRNVLIFLYKFYLTFQREVARVETTYKHEVDLLEKEYENVCLIILAFLDLFFSE